MAFDVDQLFSISPAYETDLVGRYLQHLITADRLAAMTNERHGHVGLQFTLSLPDQSLWHTKLLGIA